MEKTENSHHGTLETLELGRRPDTTKADGECPECQGTVWDVDGEVVCGSCAIVLSSSRDDLYESEWSYFFADRPEHWNSGHPRCVGGFPWVYDWVDNDEVDGSVTDVEATEFYR